MPIRTTSVSWPSDIGGNGSHYEIVAASWDFTWFDAHEFAKSQFRSGVRGHLATLNSCEEERFLAIFLMSLSEDPALLRYMFRERFYCLGAWNANDYPPDGGPSGWRWITGEPFDAAIWRPFVFNWDHVGEPVLAWRLSGAVNTGMTPAPIDVGVIHNHHIDFAVPCGLIIEYDGLAVVDEPPSGAVESSGSRMGDVKALFR